MGIGDVLLRILYRRVHPPILLYREAAEAACDTHAEIIVDAGGGTGILANALACHPSLYILLDPDPFLVEAGPHAPWTERVVGDGRHPPLRKTKRCTIVLHDALHHIPEWRRALRSIIGPCSCIVVSDYDPSTLRGRLLQLLERILGFPAEFETPHSLAEALRKTGFRVTKLRGGFNYLIVACRTQSNP